MSWNEHKLMKISKDRRPACAGVLSKNFYHSEIFCYCYPSFPLSFAIVLYQIVEITAQTCNFNRCRSSYGVVAKNQTVSFSDCIKFSSDTSSRLNVYIKNVIHYCQVLYMNLNKRSQAWCWDETILSVSCPATDTVYHVKTLKTVGISIYQA